MPQQNEVVEELLTKPARNFMSKTDMKRRREGDESSVTNQVRQTKRCLGKVLLQVQAKSSIITEVLREKLLSHMPQQNEVVEELLTRPTRNFMLKNRVDKQTTRTERERVQQTRAAWNALLRPGQVMRENRAPRKPQHAGWLKSC